VNTRHQWRRFRHFLRANEAVSALEYAMVIGIMAVILSAALVAFSGNIETALTAIGTEIGNQKIGTTTKLE
jgi:Flp pilus assembly pilin Flp